MTESEIKPSIIAKGRYKYEHIRPPEAIDVHHIIVARRGAGGLMICTYALIFVFICFLIHLLLQDVTIVFRILMPDQPVAIVLWSFALAGFLLRQFLRKQVEKESVIIFPAFGVQLETVFRSGRTLRQFVPIGKILKPVLNECVTPVTCYWSLSLILHGEKQLLQVFKGLYPPVTMLVPIWKALCAAIDDEECTDIHSDCNTR